MQMTPVAYPDVGQTIALGRRGLGANVRESGAAGTPVRLPGGRCRQAPHFPVLQLIDEIGEPFQWKEADLDVDASPDPGVVV